MPILILAVFCVLSTGWVILDARRRNRNAGLWGVVMALSTGLALPVYLISRSRKAA